MEGKVPTLWLDFSTGDFNSVISDNIATSKLINKFLLDNNLSRCDVFFPS